MTKSYQTSLGKELFGLAPNAELLARKAKLQAKIVQSMQATLQAEGQEISLVTIQTLSHAIVHLATTTLKIDLMNIQLGLLNNMVKNLETSSGQSTTGYISLSKGKKTKCTSTISQNLNECEKCGWKEFVASLKP